MRQCWVELPLVSSTRQGSHLLVCDHPLFLEDERSIDVELVAYVTSIASAVVDAQQEWSSGR